MLRTPPAPAPVRVLAGFLIATIAGCGGSEPTPPPPPPPPKSAASIAISTGDAQQAAAGTAVAVPPAVLVRDAGGAPFAGAVVQFAVTAGGGAVAGGSATTDAAGIARVTSWTLGASGEQRLTATTGSVAPVTFTATLTPDTETTTVDIGPGGGTLHVTTPGHPLQGLAVTVPAGSFVAAGALSVAIAANATAPALPSGYRVAGPIIDIITTQGRASRLMTVQVPVTRAANEDIVLTLHDPSRGVTEVLPTIARGATSVTVLTAHLNGDLLLGPGTAAGLRTGRMGSVWLMPIAFTVPQPPVSLPEISWPVLDHGSATSPDGFGSAIPALIALASARGEQDFVSQIRPLATPGFYAEAAPVAVTSRIWARQKGLLRSLTAELATAMQPLPKAERDEILHRNLIASMVLSSSKAVMTAFTSGGTEGAELFGNAVEGSEESLDIVHPAVVTKRIKVRRTVGGYDPVSVPVTPDQPLRTMSGALAISSFLLPFEEVAGDLSDLRATLALPEHSAERKTRNRMLASLEAMIPPTMEVRLTPTEGWHRYSSGPIAIRSETAQLRSTDNDPPTLAIHDEAGEVVVMAVATPIEAEAIAVALPVGEPKNLVISGVETVGGRLRQKAPMGEGLVWVPFQIVPEHFPLAFGASEVTFDAAVPYPPEGGYRIRWNWGDGDTTEVANSIRGVHNYEVVRDRRVIATLLPATGETVLAVDTARVTTGQPFWKITTFLDADGFYSNPPEPEEMDDVFFRSMNGAGLIALVPVPGGRELRLYAKGSGTWEAAECCPPPFTPSDDWLMIGENPRVFHGELGSFWSSWRDTGLIFNGTISDGTFSGHSIGPKHTFTVEDGGQQVGTEYGLEFNLHMDGKSISGIMTLTIWGIDEETGEVGKNSESKYRFIVGGERLH